MRTDRAARRTLAPRPRRRATVHVTPAPLESDAALALEPILASVKTLLRGRDTVTLPSHGIDLMFDDGVVVKCRACNVSWPVRRTQFTTPSWWSCPNGCGPA